MYKKIKRAKFRFSFCPTKMMYACEIRIHLHYVCGVVCHCILYLVQCLPWTSELCARTKKCPWFVFALQHIWPICTQVLHLILCCTHQHHFITHYPVTRLSNRDLRAFKIIRKHTHTQTHRQQSFWLKKSSIFCIFVSIIFCVYSIEYVQIYKFYVFFEADTHNGILYTFDVPLCFFVCSGSCFCYLFAFKFMFHSLHYFVVCPLNEFNVL